MDTDNQGRQIRSKTNAPVIPGHAPAVAARRDAIVYALLCLGLVIVILTLWVIVSRFNDARRQARINNSYLLTKAVVQKMWIRQGRAWNGTIYYVPEVEYAYRVGDRVYSSTRLTVLPSRGSKAWAQSILDRYPINKPCTAFYNPDAPSQSILFQGYSFAPYSLILEGGFALVAGAFLIVRSLQGRRRGPIMSEGGWFELQAEFSKRQMLFNAHLCTLLWYAVLLTAGLHYFTQIPPPHPSRAIFTFLGYALLGLIPLRVIVLYHAKKQVVSEARVFLDALDVIVGGAFFIRISQRALRELTIREYNVCLTCTGTKIGPKGREYETLYNEICFLTKNCPFQAGRPIEFKHQLTIPHDQMESGHNILRTPQPRPAVRAGTAPGAPARENEPQVYARVEWEIALECKISNGPDYHANFPLTVGAI